MQLYASGPKILRITYGHYNCHSISAIYGDICNELKFFHMYYQDDNTYRSPVFSASISSLTAPLSGIYYPHYPHTDRIEIKIKYSDYPNTGLFHKTNKSKNQFIVLKRMHPLLGKVHIYKI